MCFAVSVVQLSRKYQHRIFSTMYKVTVYRTLYAVFWGVRTTFPQLSNGVIMTKVIPSI
jgi:presenilin-like A22 family membrane protease